MRIGFLGSGKMAEAILAALIRNGIVKASEVLACDVVADRRAFLKQRYRVGITDSAEKLVQSSDVIILAVKPQDLDAVLRQVAPLLQSRKLLISIAAGKTLAHLQRLVGARVRIVRVMPNLPVMVGEGMSVFCLGSRARPADRRLVSRLLGCCGRVLELPERHFDAVTALSGSGPAFFAYVMEALAAGARRAGLPASAARALSAQTMLGTARYLLETERDPSEFIQAVASPKGTTAAGLKVLYSSALQGILGRTIHAAAKRSRELSRRT